MLRSGVDAVTEVPASRWDNGRFFDPDFRTPGKVSTRHGSFLKDVDQFDAAFFGISPREAENMDPQHRLLLEVTWEALERAGQAPAGLMGSNTGVFVGISNSDYQRLLLSDLESIDPYVATGNLFSVAAGRLSYILGLHGPNVAVDTACSSSLVAVHLAVQSLRQGECDLALAGGVSLMLSPAISVNFSKAQMMAADGRCKTFDAAADGYVRGEGCIVIVLKRLAEAVEHGDPILAVIRGSAINHDGRSGGLTAPNGPAQTAVIRAALANAGVQAQQIRLCGDTRHRHGAWRSDRSARPGRCPGPGARRRQPPADRVGQDEPGAPGGRRRAGRAREGRALPAAQADPAALAPADVKPTHRLGGRAGRDSDAADGMGGRARICLGAHGGSQRVWPERNECACDPPGGARAHGSPSPNWRSSRHMYCVFRP